MPPETSAREAREFCRWVLPRVSRTFAINIEWLDPGMRESVRTAYLLCRAADALEDSWPDSPSGIRARFHEFLAALDGDAAAAARLAEGARARADGAEDLGLLAHLPLLLGNLATLSGADQAILRRGVRVMAEGMSRYASRAAERGDAASYLDDTAELRDYCFVVAGCVGVLLTELIHARRAGEPEEVRRRRLELAPRVGEALQLTNILLDWPADVRRGRSYLPASWLAEHGLTVADLSRPDRPQLRALALRLESLAHAALDQVADYMDTIPRRHLRYRLFCLWPALWARASLRLVHGAPEFPAAATRPKLSRRQLWNRAACSLPVVFSHRGVRAILAQDAPRPARRTD